MSTVNESALRLLLSPVSECPMIGPEMGLFERDGVSYVFNQYGSVRYVYCAAGQPVAALQIMVGAGKAVATNAYTNPEFRRKGLATELAKRAAADIPGLEFSDERSADGQAWVASIEKSHQKRPSNKTLSATLRRMVAEAPDELAAVLFNWNESELDESKTGLVRHPGRDGRYSRGSEGGKDRVKIADLLAWLRSDAPFDRGTYGPKIDPEWRYQVTRLRHLAGLKPETFYEALLGSGMARLPDGHARNYTMADGTMLPTLERAGVRISMSSNTLLYEQNGRVMAGIAEPDEWAINALQVDPALRRKGLATQAMTEITQLSDQFGITLHLEVTPIWDRPMPREQLATFYARFGFSGGTVQKRTPSEEDTHTQRQRSAECR